MLASLTIVLTGCHGYQVSPKTVRYQRPHWYMSLCIFSSMIMSSHENTFHITQNTHNGCYVRKINQSSLGALTKFCCYPEQYIEWTVKLPTIWESLMLIWCHCIHCKLLQALVQPEEYISRYGSIQDLYKNIDLGLVSLFFSIAIQIRWKFCVLQVPDHQQILLAFLSYNFFICYVFESFLFLSCFK